MDLLRWKKMRIPKHIGGLGLRYPSILNKVLSGKNWWRWLKSPHNLWACLWRIKYTPIALEKELIRWNSQGPGSLIWNEVKQKKGMVIDHALWELQDGTSALFWSGSW
jgi:hypothetical protein